MMSSYWLSWDDVKSFRWADANVLRIILWSSHGFIDQRRIILLAYLSNKPFSNIPLFL